MNVVNVAHMTRTETYKTTRKRIVSAALLIASMGLPSAIAHAEPVKVYRAGQASADKPTKIRVVRANGRHLTSVNAREGFTVTDVPELLGGPNSETKRTKRKKHKIQRCNSASGEVCLSRGSQIVYVSNRKN